MVGGERGALIENRGPNRSCIADPSKHSRVTSDSGCLSYEFSSGLDCHAAARRYATEVGKVDMNCVELVVTCADNRAELLERGLESDGVAEGARVQMEPICKTGHRRIGSVSGAYGRCAEIDSALEDCRAGCEGNGIGSRLYAALFDSLKDEDIERVVAGITLPNPASVRLHRRFGFRLVGTFHRVGRKFERFWDVSWFERPLRAEGSPDPGSSR